MSDNANTPRDPRPQPRGIPSLNRAPKVRIPDSFIVEFEQGHISANHPEDNSSSDDTLEQGYPEYAVPQTNGHASQPLSSQAQEAEKAINVGWVAGCDANEEDDIHLTEYLRFWGNRNYNFVSYPIGGMKRMQWRFHPDGSNKPPPIALPDMQMANNFWESFVCAQISPWIDCDSPDPVLAQLSAEELIKELNYASYLSVSSIHLRLKRFRSPKLAALLNKWLWTKNTQSVLWIVVPTSTSVVLFGDDDTQKDIWTMWADFRSQLTNFTYRRVIVGLELTENIDDEFIEAPHVTRWRGEPLALFVVPKNVFTTAVNDNHIVLSSAHSTLLRMLWPTDKSRILIDAQERKVCFLQRLLFQDGDQVEQYAAAVRVALRNIHDRENIGEMKNFLSDVAFTYVDVPLQPLSDNLDSAVYNVFEMDPIKYDAYRDAIFVAIGDYAADKRNSNDLVMYILGGGRGPIVNAAIIAFDCFRAQPTSRKLKLNLVVVEKNPNAVVTLNYLTTHRWHRPVTVLQCDMRDLKNEEFALQNKPDIIVSELLGSFGDNELSPECLDGVNEILKASTISIPQSYTSYACPVHSTAMYQTILNSTPSFWMSGIGGNGRALPEQREDGSWRYPPRQPNEIVNMDQVYVVCMRAGIYCAQPDDVFTFEHPNFAKKTNERTKEVPFKIPMDIMGFAGFFTVKLYKHVVLSINPDVHSLNLTSWFPALIPLRKMLRVKTDDEIKFCIDRKVDKDGVWYEWFVKYKDESGNEVCTPRQNTNGESCFMRL